MLNIDIFKGPDPKERGQKPPLKLKEIWAIRMHLQSEPYLEQPCGCTGRRRGGFTQGAKGYSHSPSRQKKAEYSCGGLALAYGGIELVRGLGPDLRRNHDLSRNRYLTVVTAVAVLLL